MDENTVAALLNVKREIGADILNNPQRVAALLADFLPAQPGERQYGERQVLVNLLQAGVPQQLTAKCSKAEFDALVRQWAASLCTKKRAMQQALRIWQFVAHASPDAAIDIQAILDPNSDEEDLVRAVQGGDAARVQSLLAAGVDANARDSIDQTPLMWARDTQTFVLLLAAGADVNAKESGGHSVLIELLRRDAPVQVLTRLLAAGADIHAASHAGTTALMFAALWERKEALKLLLAAGADINATDKDGNTALMYTCRDYHVHKTTEIARLLLDAGADINAQDNRGETVLMKAVRNQRIEHAQTLLAAGADVNIKDNNGNTALGLLDSTGIVRALLAAGAHP